MTKPEINALISKWQHVLHVARDIPSWTEDHCLAYLAELASKSSRIIECGTYAGRSAKMMLLANPNLQLSCIDKFDLVFGMESICRNFTLKTEVDSGRCVLVNGDSEEGAKKMIRSTQFGLTQGWVPEELMCDAIWIDDGHLKTDLERDIRCLMPFLKPGCVMVGHDFDPGSEVEQGVFARLPVENVSQPVPRMWSYTKP